MPACYVNAPKHQYQNKHVEKSRCPTAKHRSLTSALERGERQDRSRPHEEKNISSCSGVETSTSYPSRDGNASLRTDSGDGYSYESQCSHSTNNLHNEDSLIEHSLRATQNLQTERNLSGPRSGSNPSKRARMDSRSTSTYPQVCACCVPDLSN